MPGHGDPWLCPSAPREVQKLGNTYQFRQAMGPKFYDTATPDQIEINERTDPYRQPFDQLEIALSNQIPWVFDSRLNFYPNAIPKAAVRPNLPAEATYKSSPAIFDAVFGALASNDMGITASEVGARHLIRQSKGGTAAYFDGSASLQGSE